MKPVGVAQILTALLVALALAPTLWILSREALRRRGTKRALAKVEAARKLLAADADRLPEDLAAELKARFDPITGQRVVLQLIHHEDAATRALGQRLFVDLGLVEQYAKLLRDARKWSERTHAAETLGAAAAPAAVPALVAALRDPHEDEDSVKVAAATALAKLRDQSAIPLLVAELSDTDGKASRTVAEALVAFGELAVPPLLELVTGGGPSPARVWAARALGRIADGRATDPLVARLNDRDDLLRMAAAEALGSIGDARALQPLVRATLRDPAPQVRAHAAGAVAKIEGERAVDVLVAALADPDYATRLRALEAFETMRALDTTPLETALRDPNIEVRRRAALALERVGHLEQLIQRLQSEDPTTQKRAYESFLELGRAGLVDSVASYVHHASFEVRALAARAAGELGAVRVAPLLASAMDDESWPVRAAIAEALGRLRDDKSISTLVKRLTDPEEPVREAAAEALTNYPPESLATHVAAIAAAYDTGTVPVRLHVIILSARVLSEEVDPLLVRASSDPSDVVRLRAVTALGDRRGHVIVEPLVLRLTDASLEVRMAAVSALGSAVSPEAFEGLMKALTGAPLDVRERIAEALSRGARDLLFARLDELEKSTSLDVRLGVAWTLGKTLDPRAVPVLARFLRDPSAPLRASAAGALAKIETLDSLAVLVVAADDPDGRVRAAVVNALGRAGGAGDARVVPTLTRRLADPDPFVRNRALVSLARAARHEAEEVILSAKDVDSAARMVALALVGTEQATGMVLDAVTRPQALDAATRFLAKEDPVVRAAFFSAVGLDDPGADVVRDVDQRGLVEKYEGLLRSSLDVSARRLAVRALARLRVERAYEVLGDAVTADPDEGVRLAAADALQPHADVAAVRRAFVRSISDPNTRVAEASVRGLMGRREPEVTQALLKRLGGGEASAQGLVEETLAVRFRDDPMAFVDWMMGIDVPMLLVPCVRVLGLLASPETASLLRELLRSQSALVRAEATRALGVLPMADVGESLRGLATDPDEGVRLSVLEVLSKREEFLDASAHFRQDPSTRVRSRAATLLASVTGPAAVRAHDALAEMTSDAAAEVRGAALASLAASPDGDGVMVFAKLFAKTALDTRLAIRQDARAREISEVLAARLTSSGVVDERRAVVLAIGALGAGGRGSLLLPALRDPSPEVRVAAVRALASSDDEAIRARITDLLTDPEASVRDAARRSMLRTVG